MEGSDKKKSAKRKSDADELRDSKSQPQDKRAAARQTTPAGKGRSQ